jgi:ABC-type microcin C transport system duplicated ATPase subunit YejF
MSPAGTVLEVDDVAKHFVVQRTLFGRPRATAKAVDGVSLSLQAARRWLWSVNPAVENPLWGALPWG